MKSSTPVTGRSTVPGRASPRLREARLRYVDPGLYPGLAAGEWRTAAVLADQMLAGQLLRGMVTAVRGRVLPEDHFEFRGGVATGGEREGVRLQRAKA